MDVTMGDLKDLLDHMTHEAGFLATDFTITLYHESFARETTNWDMTDEIPKVDTIQICGELEKGDNEISYFEVEFDWITCYTKDDQLEYITAMIASEFNSHLLADKQIERQPVLIQLDGSTKAHVDCHPMEKVIFLQSTSVTKIQSTRYEQVGFDEQGNMKAVCYFHVNNRLVLQDQAPGWSKLIAVPAGVFSNPLNESLGLEKKLTAYWGSKLYYDQDFPQHILVLMGGGWIWMNYQNFVDADIKEFRDELNLMWSIH